MRFSLWGVRISLGMVYVCCLGWVWMKGRRDAGCITYCDRVACSVAVVDAEASSS